MSDASTLSVQCTHCHHEMDRSPRFLRRHPTFPCSECGQTVDVSERLEALDDPRKMSQDLQEALDRL